MSLLPSSGMGRPFRNSHVTVPIKTSIPCSCRVWLEIVLSQLKMFNTPALKFLNLWKVVFPEHDGITTTGLNLEHSSYKKHSSFKILWFAVKTQEVENGWKVTDNSYTIFHPKIQILTLCNTANRVIPRSISSTSDVSGPERFHFFWNKKFLD